MAKTRTIEEQEELNKQLSYAATKGDIPAIKKALKDGAEVDSRNPNLYTPLDEAAFNGKTDAIIALLEAGAEVDPRGGNHQFTPLHWAAFEGHGAAAEVLLAAGADPTLLNVDGKTSVDVAHGNGNKALANYLQSIVDAPEKRPTPEGVGLDMNRRNEALKTMGKPIPKPVVGAHTAKVLTGMEAQRLAALNDPGEGI